MQPQHPRLIDSLRASHLDIRFPILILWEFWFFGLRLTESRRDAEYAGAVNTSLEGQKYLQQHPNLQWRDDDAQQQQQIPSLGSTSLYSGKGSQRTPAQDSGMDSAYGVKGLSYGREYSEAEVPGDLAYPSSHSVRKHGGGPAPYRPPPRTNPRRQQESPFWPTYDEPMSPQGIDAEFERSNNGPEDDLLGGWEPANQERVKRHVGPQDGDGIQRLISTGKCN